MIRDKVYHTDEDLRDGRRSRFCVSIVKVGRRHLSRNVIDKCSSGGPKRAAYWTPVRVKQSGENSIDKESSSHLDRVAQPPLFLISSSGRPEGKSEYFLGREVFQLHQFQENLVSERSTSFIDIRVRQK